jgi:succinate dehydrogenase/fumarate reductase flavoprotein subunit
MPAKVLVVGAGVAGLAAMQKAKKEVCQNSVLVHLLT